MQKGFWILMLRYQSPKNNLEINFVPGTRKLSQPSLWKKNIFHNHSTSIKAKCVKRPKGGDQLDNSRANPAEYLCFLRELENESTLESGNIWCYTGCQQMSVVWVQCGPKAMLLDVPSAELKKKTDINSLLHALRLHIPSLSCQILGQKWRNIRKAFKHFLGDDCAVRDCRSHSGKEMWIKYRERRRKVEQCLSVMLV